MNIKREWEHCGYRCSVAMNAIFMRCGYVDVPIGHPLYGVDYDDVDGISVHGGLTYSDYTDDRMWRLGFDCAHLGDGIDLDALEAAHDCGSVSDSVYAELADFGGRLASIEGGFPTVWTEDMVAEEVEYLAEQLKLVEARHG